MRSTSRSSRSACSDVAVRSAFLIRDGETIEAAWLLGGELPDIDAVIAAAAGPQRRLSCSRRVSMRRPYLNASQPSSQ